MTLDKISVSGILTIKVIDGDGNQKTEITIPNMVVSGGKSFIISRVAPNPPAYMSHMGLGSSNQPSSQEMTSLVSEATVSGNKVRSSLTTVTNANSITYSATFAPNAFGGSYTAKEAGIFNSATNGTMLARTVFPSVLISSIDTVVINWTITLN